MSRGAPSPPAAPAMIPLRRAAWMALAAGGLVLASVCSTLYVARATPGGASRDALTFAGVLTGTTGPQGIGFVFRKDGDEACAPEPIPATPDAEGAFSVEIPLGACPKSLFDGGDVTYDVLVGGQRVVKDAAVSPVPYAKYADRVAPAQLDALGASLAKARVMTPWNRADVKNEVTLSDTETDLGAQLNALLETSRDVAVVLPKGGTYTWNTAVELTEFQRLTVTGEGYSNGAGDLTVAIHMTQNRVDDSSGTASKAVQRVQAAAFSYFGLYGVSLSAVTNDPLPYPPDPVESALFILGGDYATIELSQIRILTTEDVVNASSYAYGRVKLGWTFIDKDPSFVPDVYAIKANSGWGFGGHGAVVARSHSTMGPGVLYEATPRLQYLD
ncbi:hypothetical protein [Sorangium sp. So ce131]|uniref:hypothetical protein n=1 Tax=Sorangium sp. So ce131 TaxID=3133282 RepID=UPI003F5F7A50